MTNVKTSLPVSSSFKSAVENTPDVKDGFQVGLKAVRKKDRELIDVADSRLLDGSLDIDGQVKSKYPHAPRWDYAVAYGGRVCFCEVHPAYTSEVSKMIKKLKWLKDWLRTNASLIGNLPSYHPKYVWIASGKCGITKNSPQAKLCASSGLMQMPKLTLTCSSTSSASNSGL